MSSATGGVWELIEENSGEGGMVDMQRLWSDCTSLTIDSEYIDSIVAKIRDAGLIWFWGEQMVVAKPFNCWTCGRRVDERVSAHMDECLRVQRKVAGYLATKGGS
jgi:hypothetical protein